MNKALPPMLGRHIADYVESPHAPEAGHTSLEVVWQWIYYGLWEATMVGLAALLTATFAYYFDNSGSSDYSFVAYILAAELCLLPVTFFVDAVYRRKERRQKRGFAAVVFVVNALAVFLAAIAGFITLVVSIMTLAVSSSSSTARPIVMAASTLVLIFGVLLFMRFINVPKVAGINFSKLFTWLTIGIPAVAILLAAVGPFSSAVASRQDRFIEANVPAVGDDIQGFISNHNKLPPTLQALHPINKNEQQLIDRNLVTYRPISLTYDNQGGQSYPTARYELCTFYQKSKGSDPNSGPNGSKDSGYIDTSSHPGGQVCYSQKY